MSLGNLRGGVDGGWAEAVSANGGVVVGLSDTASGLRAFRWTSTGGLVDLGTLPSFTLHSVATAASADGSVVVGWSEGSPGTAGGRAFRWTQAAGMVDLGVLPLGNWDSTATSVSADGAVVVGYNHAGVGGDRAFVWDEAHGMRELATILTDAGVDLTGWSLSQALAVSGDGTVVVGWGIPPDAGLGEREAWVAVLPGPPVVSTVPAAGLGLLFTVLAIGPRLLRAARSPAPLRSENSPSAPGCP